MKKITSIFLFFFVAVVFGQRRYTADKYFEEFSYVKSAEVYQKIAQKGDSTKHVLSRLADSYYFNSNAKEAVIWYQKLFQNYENDGLSLLYYFRYAQSLKSNGNYKESDGWLLKMKAINRNDSRVESLLNNEDYLEKYITSKSEFTKIHNLSLNSKYSDYGAFFNDSLIVFSSTRPQINNTKSNLYQWNKQPFYNVYSTEIQIFNSDTDIHFIDGNTIDKIKVVNSIYHDASAILTKNGKTMYFTRDNFNGKELKTDAKKVAHLKIFKAELEDGKWSNIVELPFNNEGYSVGHPALSVDENTLYFSSDMPGGFGDTDIYKVSIASDNTYGPPINLGDKINTEGKEMFPFVSSNHVLYFSSNGHIGLGGLDVFKSKIKNKTFGKIENLKQPINSNKDDFSFTINRKKRIGFFSSNRAGGKGDDDVYSFVLRKKEVICNQLLAGVVTDKLTGNILPGSKVVLYEKHLKKDSLIVGADAKYQFKIACNTNYKIVASKLFYKKGAKTFTSPKITGKTIQNIAIDLENDFQYSNGQIIVRINPIYFNYNKSTIRNDASIELNKVVAIMQKYPTLIIRSGSHTDARGKFVYNEGLSERRAKSTVKYIVSKGINPTRISGKGFGESELVNDCVDNDQHTNRVKCTKEEHQLNRRTEFVVVNASIVTSKNKVIKKSQSSIYRVANGDTLFSLAKKYNISLKKLKELNNIKENKIFVGQILKVR